MKCRAGLLFVTGTIVCLVRCSDDFRVRMLLFPKERFLNAVMPLDTALFNFMHSNPLYVYPDADADDTRNGTDNRAWKGVCLWLDMAEMLFGSNAFLPWNTAGPSSDRCPPSKYLFRCSG